jgi:glycosyltransferase involved in cell wall biosynthesis
MLAQITPLILTYNEAPNIERTLSRLKWAKDIVVVDSFSTDATCDLVRKLPQARLIQRVFDNHAAQWNFGLDQVNSPWVLSLDADYFLSHALVQELRSWTPRQGVVAYFARFRYCVAGRPLRACLYPPRAVLFRRDRCRYVDGGHTQVLAIDGASAYLRNRIDHDDRKPLDRWLREQDRYARLEAEHLLKAERPKPRKLETEEQEARVGQGSAGAAAFGIWASPPLRLCSPLSFADRVRRAIVFAPLLVFFYTLLGKGLILDGWPGWFYVFQRTYAEVLLSLRLMEAKLKG